MWLISILKNFAISFVHMLLGKIVLKFISH